MGSPPLIAVAWNAPRALAVVVLAATVVLLAFAVAASRRPAPVRLRRDLLRLLVSLGAILVMAWITGVSTSAGLVVLAIGVGLLLGVLQGWKTKVLRRDGTVFVAKAPAGVAAWGIGVVVMQAAAIAARAGVLRLGQGISWLGVGVLAGVIVGRTSRLQSSDPDRQSPVKATTALLATLAIAGTLVVGFTSPPAAAAEGVWVLESVETNPAGDEQLLTLATVAAGPGFISWSIEDPPLADIAGTFEEPPAELIPGQEYRLAVQVSARLTGGTDVQGYRQMSVIFIYQDRWDNQGVAAGVSCTDPVGAEPISCTDPMTVDGEFIFVPPAVTADGTFSVGVNALNCGGQCYTRYTYRAEVVDAGGVVPSTPPESTTSTEPPPDTQPPDQPGSAQTDAGSPDVTGQEDGAVVPAAPASTAAADDDISPGAAVGEVIGGLIAAAAIGLISAGDAGALISSILGRGPLSPAEAIAQAGGVFAPAPAEPPPPEPPQAPPPPPPPPVVAAAADGERAPARSAAPRGDPCGPLVASYRTSLQRWQTIQNEIGALENEYAAVTNYIEAQAESDFWGASFDVAMLGVDTVAGPGASSGPMDAAISAFEQSFRRSIMSQALQAVAMGREFDPHQAAAKALTDASGLGAAEAGNPAAGAHGAFLTESITGLVARFAGSDALRRVSTAVASGAIDAAEARSLEGAIEGSFAADIGPLVGVFMKYVDFWKKNREWGEGVERRNRMRNHLVDIRRRIDELEYDLGDAAVLRDADRRELARCREEMGWR